MNEYNLLKHTPFLVVIYVIYCFGFVRRKQKRRKETIIMDGTLKSNYKVRNKFFFFSGFTAPLV
jgi:preprotein translocase subunit YajC